VQTANFIFLSGQLGVSPVTKRLAGETIESQTNQIFKNISAVLAAAGIGLSSIVT
jgi:2-iminobutanoate/2-iminopropanoate deaminase